MTTSAATPDTPEVSSLSVSDSRPVGTPVNAPPHPKWDYATWPYAPREGIQSEGNNRYITQALFLETAREGQMKYVRYVLDDHDIYCPDLGRWIPSARLVYIHAADEYEAIRKLVGNLQHWERLLDLPALADVIDDWRAEQKHIQRLHIKEMLTETLDRGEQGSVTAARTLLQMIDKNPVGRPKKERQKAATPDETADHLRLVVANGERTK